MSTAPRTDAELFDPVHYSDQGGSSYGQMRRAADGDYVPSELARQLERELAEARKELWNTISAMADLCAENVEAKKDSARLDCLERLAVPFHWVSPEKLDDLGPIILTWRKCSALRTEIDAAMEVEK